MELSQSAIFPFITHPVKIQPHFSQGRADRCAGDAEVDFGGGLGCGFHNPSAANGGAGGDLLPASIPVGVDCPAIDALAQGEVFLQPDHIKGDGFIKRKDHRWSMFIVIGGPAGFAVAVGEQGGGKILVVTADIGSGNMRFSGEVLAEDAVAHPAEADQKYPSGSTRD